MTIIGIEGFRAAAAALGLRMEAPDVSWWKSHNFAMLEGVVDGTRVLVQQGVLGTSAPWMRVYFHAALEPALDLGLGISLRGALAQTLGLQQEPLGPASIANAFELKAHEPARLQTLLTPALREELMKWHNARTWERHAGSRNSIELFVTDESAVVRVQTNAFGFGFDTHPIPTEELVRDVRATAGLARAVNEAAKHVPPSVVLAPYVPIWRAFADANGLTVTDSPLRMSGVFEGVTFTARAAHLGPEGYGVELTMPFARPLPLYLRVGPKGGWFEVKKSYPDAWSEWAWPQKTGDAAFDSQLRVVSNDPETQNKLLAPDLRRALLDLMARSEHVHVTTGSIAVRTKTKVAPELFADTLRPMAAIEKLFDRVTAR